MNSDALLAALFAGETVQSLMLSLGFTRSEAQFLLENFND
jgi:hypothetical protein